ncbi:MAG: PD40 domain-containing protein [Lewinella sp.]|nr:PD40 domain-containing protein [Lewinella sp.]
MQKAWILLLSLAFIASCGNEPAATEDNTTAESAPVDTLRYEQESHLHNFQQLTFGGNNAEAYYSFDDQYLVFQSDNPEWGLGCDQIFYMPVDGGAKGQKPPMVSTGLGRTTCAYYLPGDTLILYASTHLGNEECPEVPRAVDGKYVWPIYADFDIFVADLQGNIVRQLTDHPGYDAEATLSPDGTKIVFTSTRSGDLELWTMNVDGTDLHQVTDGLGYDGGAFFSPDGTQLVFRASRPAEGEEADTYKSLLAQNVVQPTDMEVYVCNVDGTDLRQITHLGKANWAPYFHPSGEKIVFASNHHVESGRQFNIFSIDLNGENLEQITFDDTFDAFPMFSRDGKKLVFASNRHNGDTRDTNIFVADWED